MALDETRAVARLPHLDIEIRHRKAPEEGAEYLSIDLRATPDFRAAASLLDPLRLADPGRLLAAWASLNPWWRLADPFGFWRLAASMAALPGPAARERRAP
jgi:hypothetical protein